MNANETRNTSVTIQVNQLEKRKFEQLAAAYDSSQAGVGRMLVEQTYHNLFGNIHPDALERHDMDALMRGEIDPEEIADEYKVHGDGSVQVPISDGGMATTLTPSNYTPTYTPQDLADGGVELTWSELKKAVECHWSNGLEIHEHRVRPSSDVNIADDGTYNHDDYALLANQTIVSKVLIGILRGKAEEVPEQLVEDTILKYTEHQINRADKEAGRRYKVETYKKLLIEKFEYLIPHPDPLKVTYYTSEKAAKKHFGKEVDQTIQKLVEQSKWILDPCKHAQREKENPKEDPTQWIYDLASFRQQLGFLHEVRESERWSRWLTDLDNDLFDSFPTPQVAVGKTFTEMLNQYLHINQWARFAVANAVLEVKEESVLETTIFDENNVEVEVNPDQPSLPMTKWVHQRETPLSPSEQIARVSEKL